MVILYKRGYIAGVFDLFHIGHLNLIRNAKKKCEYLIVGVLSDKLVVRFKKSPPIIPEVERIEIVKALRDVDEVVLVNDKNIEKMDAWNQFRFDCLFSGDDYKDSLSWIRDRNLLQEVGSDICFFDYTAVTSSTKIKRVLNLVDTNESKILIYGAGKYGLKALEYYGNAGVLGFIDSSNVKIGTLIQNKPVFDINKIGKYLDERYTIIIALKEGKEVVRNELLKVTNAKIEYFM